MERIGLAVLRYIQVNQQSRKKTLIHHYEDAKLWAYYKNHEQDRR